MKVNKSSGLPAGQAGQASRMLLILAAVVLVAVVIVYLVIKMAERPPRPNPEPEPGVTGPVYEQTMDDIKFTFIRAKDLGGVLTGASSKNPQWQKDLVTTERYVRLTIGAQNKGKENVPDNVWDIENIVDSEGRNYVPLDYRVQAWLPEPDLCGTLLKPEFEATPCVKIYEVANIAQGLKIRVLSKPKSAEGRYATEESKKDEAYIDLIVTK